MVVASTYFKASADLAPGDFIYRQGKCYRVVGYPGIYTLGSDLQPNYQVLVETGGAPFYINVPEHGQVLCAVVYEYSGVI